VCMVLQQKLEMLDSLLEIEIAYSMLKTKSDAEGDVHPLDAHFVKLNTLIEVVDNQTDEFELLKQYVRNTHAATHTQYDLEILEVCFYDYEYYDCLGHNMVLSGRKVSIW